MRANAYTSRSTGTCYRTRSRITTICVSSSIRARWRIDARYGFKQDAVALLQEWVRDVGSSAGLSAANTRISSGAIGVPESKLELEVSFDTLAEWENFLGRIPEREHKAWTQRVRNCIVDGSPSWEIYQACPVATLEAAPLVAQQAVQPAVRPTVQPAVQAVEAVQAEIIWPAPKELQLIGFGASDEAPGGSDSTASSSSDTHDPNILYDWKGDPMVINPGDKLPFKFL